MTELKTRPPTGAVPWPLILVEGGEKSGKAQPFHSQIATPDGWTTMGEVRPGCYVLGADGKATEVTEVHERGLQPIYRLTFSDGATVEACDEHLWSTQTSSSLHRTYNKGPKKGQRNRRPPEIRTTQQIRELLLNKVVVHVPMTQPVHYSAAPPLPVDPYAIGLLLGDGGLTKKSWPTFTSGDPELLAELSRRLPAGDSFTTRPGTIHGGVKGGATVRILNSLGLMGAGSYEKFIPEIYMTAAIEDRIALIRGLMDTDGGMEGKSVTYTSVSPQLARQTQELVRSLGGSCSILEKLPYYRNASGERVKGKVAYRLTVRLPAEVCPFNLTRKVAKWRSLRPSFQTPPRRTVRSVDYVGQMPARCITVAADDHLYLTDGFVVTHNSWSIAELSASPRVGRTLWLDIGEGAGDEYGAIEGARYELIEHEGTWPSIIGQVLAARDEAQRALDAGERPVVLAIDSMTAEWDLLKDWVDAKARRRDMNAKALKRDPEAEVQITTDLWNLATGRHKDLMRILMRFPGIVVVTARGADQVAMENGKPTKNRTWKVEAQKALAFDASVWVRMSRTEHPRIIGARSVHAGIVPGEDKPKIIPDLKLDHLIFDVLQCDPLKAHTRDLVAAPDLPELLSAMEAASDRESYAVVWKLAQDADVLDQPIGDGVLRDLFYVKRDQILAAESKPEPGEPA